MAEKDEGKDKKGEGEDAAAPAPAAKSKKKLIFIVVGVVVLCAAIGVPLTMFMGKTEGPPAGELAPDAAAEGDAHSLVPEGQDDEEELAEGEEPLGAIFPLETFVVNLNGGRYIRLQVQLEFAERDIPKKFFLRGTHVRDALITLLISKTEDEMLSRKGREALKIEIKDIVNEILKKQEVKHVFFTQYLVQ